MKVIDAIVSAGDRERVVEILMAAFLNNRCVKEVTGRDGYRLFRVRRLMEYAVDRAMMFGRVLLSEDRKACALLVYPELRRVTLSSVWLDAKLVLSGIGVLGWWRAMRRERAIGAVRGKERMAYLWFFGVEPKYQRFGLGKRLMRELIVSCEQQQRAVYLETSTLSNVAWYSKFGFEVYGQVDLRYRFILLRLNVIGLTSRYCRV